MPFPSHRLNVFAPFTEGPYQETSAGFDRFQSLAKKLMAQYGFFYELFGAVPEPENAQDLHVYARLMQAKAAGFTHLDGSPIRVDESGRDPFGETRHAHLLRFFGFGVSPTLYPYDGFYSFPHNTGYEIFTGQRMPISAFTQMEPLIPYFFPTDHNFYTEITCASFLTDDRYDRPPKFPIFDPLHAPVFSPDYFAKSGLSADILHVDFSVLPVQNPAQRQAVRALNFALTLLYRMVLIQSAFTDLFGFSLKHGDMITHLRHHWEFHGHSAAGINPFHLHILNYLLSTTHMLAYLVTYCLYRDKYGSSFEDAGHTSIYLGGQSENGSFKAFLAAQVRHMLPVWSQALRDQTADAPQAEALACAIRSALQLAGLFGVAYETSPIVGCNLHAFKTVDFSAGVVRSPLIDSLPLDVRHCPESPLWRIWYPYAGAFWKKRRINRQLFLGDGRFWERYRDEPRAWLYHIGYTYSERFWQDYYRYIVNVSPLPGRQQGRRLNRLLRGSIA